MARGVTAHSIQQGIGEANSNLLRAVYGIYLLESREVWTLLLE
jgi:hypothetical protein